MKRVFIGHRGTGKSTLLLRHQQYFQHLPHYDLDLEIEKSESKNISEIFQLSGEAVFRQIEQRTFKKLTLQPSFVIALGAGFDCATIPDEIEVVYVHRRTDSDGRIFLNRPRLNKELTPLAESQFRYADRDQAFRRRADFVYHMPEGLLHADDTERKVFEYKTNSACAFVTLVPHQLSDLKKYSHLELRTDLFTSIEIQKLIIENANNFLISYRKQTTNFDFTNGLVDWALELGAVPEKLLNANLIVSSHDDSIEAALKKLKNYESYHQKLCPVIFTWDELHLGHQWQQEKPLARSFLPRTPSQYLKSRWRWYRQLQFVKQKINFIQGHQDFDDQPSLYEYLQNRPTERFAAVLGEPVHQSKTPVTQMKNFYLNVLAIPVFEHDFETAILILQKLGLVAAAVTSPLKMKAGKFCQTDLSINSMAFVQGKWCGISTDQSGLKKLIDEIPHCEQKKIVVWGGGGTLDAITEILPDAAFYSAQTQMPRVGQNKIDHPDIVIWAAPRMAGIKMPRLEWQPEHVIDLSYAENSLGLEYADRVRAKYTSGDIMFYAQAQSQLQFWQENLKE